MCQLFNCEMDPLILSRTSSTCFTASRTDSWITKRGNTAILNPVRVRSLGPGKVERQRIHVRASSIPEGSVVQERITRSTAKVDFFDGL